MLLVEELTRRKIDFVSYSMEYNASMLPKKEGNFYTTKLPFLPLWFFNKLPLKIYPSYYNYLIGEYIYYLIFRRYLREDNSNIVISKNRPSRLLKYIKKNTNKKIILEVDQQHPLFTNDVILRQKMKYQILKSNIYVNKFAINDYIKSFDYADSIIVYTEEQRNILKRYGVSKRISVIDLGIENKVQKEISNCDRKVEFICFSNHTLLKGTHRLIEIWDKYNIDRNLYIVGNQEEDFKEFLGKQNIISEKITFIEDFNKKDLERIAFNRNLVGISLSYSEGYPRVVSEFFENLIPVIVSKIINRDVDNLGFGKVVNNESDTDIINAINYLTDMLNYKLCQKNIRGYDFKTHYDFVNDLVDLLSDYA